MVSIVASRVSLSELLTERNETPDMHLVRSRRIPIVAKVGWVDGKLYLRNDPSTSTKLILIHPGDLVLSGINAPKGAIAVHDPESSLKIAATIHYSAFSIDQNKVYPWYLWWVLRSPVYQSILQQQVPRGVKSELKANQFLPVKVPLPSLEEQRKIVAALLAIYGKLAKLDQAIAEMHMACEFLPNAYLQHELQAFRQRVNFSEYFGEDLRNGMSLQANQIGQGNTAFITVGAATAHGFDPNQIKMVDVNLPPDSPFWIEPNDLLVSRGNSPELVGSVASYSGPVQKYAYPDLITRVRLDLTKADVKFFEWYLRSAEARAHIARVVTGTSPTMKKINHGALSRFPVPVLGIDEQQRIVQGVELIVSRTAQIADYLQGAKRKLATIIEAAANGLSTGAFKDQVPASARLEAEQAEELRREMKRSELAQLVSHGVAEVPENMRGGSMTSVQNSQELVSLLRQLAEDTNQPVPVIKLWQASGIQEVDTFYAFLKEADTAQKISERREGSEVYVEVSSED